jgi:hypothetical protein
VHPADRLAAYLADDLTTDERLELEADLGRDPELRAQLAAMRRADRALGDLAPTALPDGAEARLRAALADELATQLGHGEAGAGSADGSGAAGDPLGSRRAARAAQRRRRVPLAAIGGVAAALVAVAVVGTGIVGGELTGGGDEEAVTSEAADGDARVDTMDAPATEDGAAGSGFVGPTLSTGDRELSTAGADGILERDDVTELAGQGLPADAAAGVGDAAIGALTASPSLDGEVTSDEAQDVEAQEESEATPDRAPEADDRRRTTGGTLQLDGDPTSEERVDVARCLVTLLEGGETVIPVSAELVTFDGSPAVAFGVVGLDPAGVAATRPEVWVLTRQDCEVRYFGQS